MHHSLRFVFLTLWIGCLTVSVHAQGDDSHVTDPTGLFTVTIPEGATGWSFYLSPIDVNLSAPSILVTDNQDWQLFLTFYARELQLPQDYYSLEYTTIAMHWFFSMQATPIASYFPEFNQLFLMCAGAWLLAPVEDTYQQITSPQQAIPFRQLYTTCSQGGLIEEQQIGDYSYELNFAVPEDAARGHVIVLYIDQFVVVVTHYDMFAPDNTEAIVSGVLNSLQFDSGTYYAYGIQSFYSQVSSAYASPPTWETPYESQPGTLYDECMATAYTNEDKNACAELLFIVP